MLKALCDRNVSITGANLLRRSLLWRYECSRVAQSGGDYHNPAHEIPHPLHLYLLWQSLLSGAGGGKRVHTAAGRQLAAAPAGGS